MHERPLNFTDSVLLVRRSLKLICVIYLFIYLFSLREEDTSERIPPTKYGTNRGSILLESGEQYNPWFGTSSMKKKASTVVCRQLGYRGASLSGYNMVLL